MRRRFLSLTLAGAVAMLAVACDDDRFLEEQPHDFVGPGNFYQNQADAIAAINAVYATFINSTNDNYYGRNFLMMVEYPTEAVTAGRLGGTHERSLMDNYAFTPSHPFFNSVWTSAYQAINRTNAVLDRVPAISMTDSVKNRILGEARFLRALHYFNLVRAWGAVPLRLTETTVNTPVIAERAPAPQVYEAIITDLQDAITKLPVSYGPSDRGRATRGAAKALLGKVYLQRGATGVGTAADFTSAETILKEVQSSGTYSLVPNFMTLFDVYGNTLAENNTEVIFDIQNHRADGLGGRMSSHMAPNASAPHLGASTNGSVAAELNFFNSYLSTDARRAGTWLLSWNKAGTAMTYIPTGTTSQNNTAYQSHTPFPRKYLDPLMTGTSAEEPNYYLLRYADVLLMLAEAINEQRGPAEALTFVNQVRRRSAVTADLTASLTTQQFKDSLFLERRKELVLEGHGHFDSQRNWTWAKQRIETNIALGRQTGTNAQGNRYPRSNLTGPLTLTDKYKLFPLPQAVVDLNPGIGQNPGW